MGRETNRLSAAKVAKLTKHGRYSDGGGLYLQVSVTGTKSWLLRYMRHGQARHAGLGPFPATSLAEARARAQEAHRLLWNGKDPIAERHERIAAAKAEQASSITFKQAAERYVTAHESAWRSKKHRAQWAQSLSTYVYPTIGSVAVSRIAVEHVLQVLEPIWTTKTETAARIRGRIESVLDWAKVRGMRRGENPARWRGHIDALLPKPSKVAKVEHFEAMPCGNIPAFLARLRAVNSTPARALELTILTAARTSETRFATWDEIDLRNAVWIIPAVRMKREREHRIPLSPRAVEILKAQPRVRDEAFVFPGARRKRPISDAAMLKVLRQETSSCTVHGFRSSFRDWAGERTNFAREIIEHALAHNLKDKSEAAYARGDLLAKRRKLMDAWSGYCSAAPKRGSGEVVALRRAAT